MRFAVELRRNAALEGLACMVNMGLPKGALRSGIPYSGVHNLPGL